MGNICGVKIKKRDFKKIEPSDYNEIVDLVDEICGHTIPGDLIVEILCMLPVKSLARFKTVCKPWKFLINSQVFINKHLHARNPGFGMYAIGGPKKGDSICPVAVGEIVGASNGIICLQGSWEFKRRRVVGRRFVLFNPSTKEYSYVPPQLCLQDLGTEYGFSYLPKTQEYKIVCFCQIIINRYIHITTITLGKISPSRVAKKISLPGTLTSARHTSGTAMFWLGREYDSNNQIVIFYDVIEEKFGTMNVPPSPSPPNTVRRSLGLLKDSVIMFQYLRDNSTFFDIWMLINDDVSNGRSWMKYRRVGPFASGTYSLEVWWDNRWKVCCKDQSREAYENGRRNWFFCDIETDEVEYCCKIQRDQGKYGIINYQESLVSINSLLPCIDHGRPIHRYRLPFLCNTS